MIPAQSIIKRGALALLSVAIGVGCSSSAPMKLEQIQVTPKEVTMQVGETQQFAATGVYGNGTTEKQNKDITANDKASDRTQWVVSNPLLGQFSETTKGLITAVAPGTFTVSAYNGVQQGTAQVTVVPARPKTIELSPTTPKVVVGTTLKLTAIAQMPGNRTEDVTPDAEWSSSDDSIATVSMEDGKRGTVTGVAAGTVTLRAKVGDVVGEIALVVEAVRLSEIVLTPAMPRIAKGTSVQLIATGKFSDKTQLEVTSALKWTSEDESIATVSNEEGKLGFVTGMGKGTVKITATDLDSQLSAFVNINVTDAAVVSVTVSPLTTLAVINTTTQLQAFATLTDQTTLDVTARSQWSSSNISVATVSNEVGKEGTVSALVLGDATITANYLGNMATSKVSVVPLSLTKLEIEQAAPSAAKGTTLQLSAKGTYNDGSTKDLTGNSVWSSSATSIVKMDPVTKGLASAQGVGTADIIATFGLGANSVPSAPVTFTVTPATLTKLDITVLTASIEKGSTYQFRATGTFSDKSTQDMTTQVIWSSSNPNVASIDAVGLANGLYSNDGTILKGTTNITCALNGVASTAAAVLTVTDNPIQKVELAPVQGGSLTLAKGESVQLVATGTFLDGSTTNLSSNAAISWLSSAPTSAAVSTSGLVSTGQTSIVGTADITATYKGTQSLPLTVTIAEAKVKTLAISPANATIEQDATKYSASQQYTAIALYSDGHSAAPAAADITWQSDSAIATIDANGLATTGTGTGTAHITATSGGISSGAVNLNVATLNTIAITTVPASATPYNVVKGFTLQFKATGAYSDGTTKDLTSTATWTSSAPTVAEFDATTKGLLNALANGSTNVTAALGTVTNSTTVSVTDLPPLTQITIAPATVSIAKGATQQFTATGKYADNTTHDITSQVTWYTSNGTVATVNSAGLATGLTAGSANIFAASGTVISNQAALTVTAPTVLSIDVTPAGPLTLAKNGTQQFTAFAAYSDNTTVEVTSTATWTSSDSTVGQFSGTTKGLLTALKAGSVTVTAKVGSTTSAPVQITVPAANLASLAVTMSAPSVGVGFKRTLSATGTYDDSSTGPITTGITWAVADQGIATVSAAGEVTGVTAGSTTVTASVTTSSGTITSPAFTITVVGLTSIALSPTTLSLTVNQTQSLTATATFSDNSTATMTTGLTWNTSDGAVASVTAGAVKGLAGGTANITAVSGAVTSNAVAVTVTAPTVCTGVVINELQLGKNGSGNDEFVELYNPCSSPADIGGWKLIYHSSGGSADNLMITFSANATIPANGYIVVINSNYTSYAGPATTLTTTQGMAAGGGGVLLKNGSTVRDSIGWGGTAGTGTVEGTKVTYTSDSNPAKSIARKVDGVDSDNNNSDFSVTATPTPGAANTIN